MKTMVTWKWLAQRAYAIRTSTDWTKEEKELSWRAWEYDPYSEGDGH